jgi:hypothetical protein
VIPECEECRRICKPVPLSINFLRPVREVTIFSLRPTNSTQVTYKNAFTDLAPKNVKLVTTFAYTDTDIATVKIGDLETQPPAVVQLEYLYISKEDSNP